ncbi:ATP-binding protein [Pedococcus sp. KACC 23699]|uniref:histidine kinase n=1 Tax=Pedococcus sp. KACC 23699 TaxID=3149228 RepID=A0AAU7JQR0_9MICO
MSRPAQWSVAAQLRLLVVTMLCIVPVVAGAALLTVHDNSRDTARGSQALSPALDATAAVRQEMADANARWSRELVGSATGADSQMQASLTSIQVLVDRQQAALGRDVLPKAERTRYLQLSREQEAAARAWFDVVDRSRSGAERRTRAEVVAAADQRFDAFRAASTSLESQLVAERLKTRERVAGAFDRLLVLMAALTLLSTVGAYLMWRTIEGSLSRPIVLLRGVVGRQRAGDGLARADSRSGAAEIRALAEDFNDLTTTNRALMEEQAQVLHMHELVLQVAQMVRSVDDIEEVLQLVCSHLGTAMSADRVLLYTLGDGEEAVEERVQWHREDLPPLPPLPPSLARSVPDVNRELRREGSVFVIRDLLDPEVARDERAAAFHRATGARSMVMVPVGVGERGLGVLALMTVDIYRRWRRFEIQAVQQCAGYLAQTITQLRLNEMQLEQVRRLTELDRQKTDFMATVSHELRTPLTSISGYLELLEDGDYGGLEDAQGSALRVIGRNATRLRGLIEDLLVLNKIEATGLESDPEDVLVSDVVRGVTEMLQPVAARGSVQLVIHAVDPCLKVHVDRIQLERALINLGSNAVKFTPAGGVASITTRAVGRTVEIVVADTGIGIPAKDQAKLFDRFFRASNANAQAIPGTGLGLAIVRAIVEGHAGTLTFVSVEGEGTTMTISLPLLTAPSSTSRTANGSGTRSPRSAGGNEQPAPTV